MQENEENQGALEDTAGQMFLSWEAPEYFEHEHNTDWYWWVGLGAVLLLGLAIWQKSFLFGVLILLGWFTMVLFAVRPPRTLRFAVAERGILIEDRLYPWSELQSFWVFYNPPQKQEISLESKKTLMPYIKIPLAYGITPEEIRDLLLEFLPEEEQEESLIDSLSHLAKF